MCTPTRYSGRPWPFTRTSHRTVLPEMISTGTLVELDAINGEVKFRLVVGGVDAIESEAYRLAYLIAVRDVPVSIHKLA